MKYQRLVSSTTPSSLQEWLGEELESRGIDCVYTRYILSLLQQDSLDIEPFECRHIKNNQQKVFHKYGGPESLHSVTKSKHQKWKTYGKQILLTASATCCAAVSSDLERMKKNAAVECLRSASEDINDIEKLIDEVCIKLKNVKNLTDENEEKSLRNGSSFKRDSFYIPPSSPTEEIEKYFAAFPPLNGKTEQKTELGQQKSFKNVWCNCLLKKNGGGLAKDTLLKSIKNSDFIKKEKGSQPVIPYSSLKAIKNIYKKDSNNSRQNLNSLESPEMEMSLCHAKYAKQVPSEQLYIMPHQKIEVIKVSKYIAHEGEFEGPKYSLIIRSITSPLENVNIINLWKCNYNKFTLINYLGKISTYEMCEIIAKFKMCSVNNSIQVLMQVPTAYESSNRICNVGNEFDGNIALKSVIDYKSKNLKDLPTKCKFYLGFQSTALYYSDKHEHLDTAKPILSPFKAPECKELQGPLSSFSQYDTSKIISSFNNQREICQNIFKSSSQSFHEYQSLEENSSCKEVLTFKVHCPVILFKHYEESKFVQVKPSLEFDEPLCGSNDDDEIFYSDDDSCEIFYSDDEDNLFTSSKTHFQPIQQALGCSNEFDQKSDIHESEYFHKFSEQKINTRREDSKRDNLACMKPYIGQKLLKKALSIHKVIVLADLKIRTHSSLSSFDELASIFQCPGKNNSEFIDVKTEKIKNLPDFNDRGMMAGFKEIHPNNCERNKVLALASPSTEISSEWSVNNSQDQCDKKWLSRWEGNFRNIEHIWHKNFDDKEEHVKNDGVLLQDDSADIVALRKEIKEEQDELLRGLCCMNNLNEDCIPIGSDHEVHVPKSTNLHSEYIDISLKTFKDFNDVNDVPMNELLVPSETVADITNCNKNFDSTLPVPLVDPVDVFTVDNGKNELLDAHTICPGPDYVGIGNETYQAANFLGLSAFRGQFENRSAEIKEYYMEGGGWSLASDSFVEMDSEPFYDRSSSLGDLNVTESGYFNFLQQERPQISSEAEDDGDKLNIVCRSPANYLRKRIKNKSPPWKRPCSFFMEGTCRRKDCRFSHDLSTITCRFWQEGSCFKGITCPFLHGFVSDKEIAFRDDHCLKNRSPDHSYSLESEADFPSLSSVKCEASIAKSDPVDIVQDKGSRKKRKKDKLLFSSHSLLRDEQETSSSWPGYKSI